VGIMDDPRTELLMTAAGVSIACVLDAHQRHAVSLALGACAYMVAALPDEAITLGDMVRLIKWFGEGFNVEGGDDGD